MIPTIQSLQEITFADAFGENFVKFHTKWKKCESTFYESILKSLMNLKKDIEDNHEKEQL